MRKRKEKEREREQSNREKGEKERESESEKLERKREKIYSREILFHSCKKIKQPVQLQFHFSSNHLENFIL